MFCLSINLLITHEKESPNIGNPMISNDIDVLKLFVWSIIPAKFAPKKVLPISPINILAGGQFIIRKPIIDPINAK